MPRIFGAYERRFVATDFRPDAGAPGGWAPPRRRWARYTLATGVDGTDPRIALQDLRAACTIEGGEILCTQETLDSFAEGLENIAHAWQQAAEGSDPAHTAAITHFPEGLSPREVRIRAAVRAEVARASTRSPERPMLVAVEVF